MADSAQHMRQPRATGRQPAACSHLKAGVCAGTLTLNQLSVRTEDMLVMPGFSQQEAVRLAALSANDTTGEPIDVVLHDSYPARAQLWRDHQRTK